MADFMEILPVILVGAVILFAVIKYVGRFIVHRVGYIKQEKEKQENNENDTGSGKGRQ